MKKFYFSFYFMLLLIAIIYTSVILLCDFYNLHWLFFIAIILIFFTSLNFMIVLYYKKISYQCKNCGEVFKPTLKNWFLAGHTPTRRNLVCPHCKQKCWCKELLTDNIEIETK